LVEKKNMNDETLGNGCLFSGPGRGDCEHFIGYPSPIHRPGIHDGPDDTRDEYDKPNGWCWSCWKSWKIQELHNKIEELKGGTHYMEVIGNISEEGK